MQRLLRVALPPDIYENINDFWEEQAEAESEKEHEAS